jgi:DNA-binding transcriptional MerR regulator
LILFNVHVKVGFKVKMLRIGDVARRAGVRASALRYYETRGLLRPAARLPNGYRLYGEDAIAELRFLRRAQALGMKLEEIAELLALSRRGKPPCARVRELARRHIEEVEARLRELSLLREELKRLLARKGRRASRHTVCPLVEEAKRVSREQTACPPTSRNMDHQHDRFRSC